MMRKRLRVRTKLIVTPNIDRPDDLYAEIIAAHAGKSDDESMKINARLILILANHIGDRQVIERAVAIASNGAENIVIS